MRKIIDTKKLEKDLLEIKHAIYSDLNSDVITDTIWMEGAVNGTLIEHIDGMLIDYCGWSIEMCEGFNEAKESKIGE